jgi:hypothetical protein
MDVERMPFKTPSISVEVVTAAGSTISGDEPAVIGVLKRERSPPTYPT